MSGVDGEKLILSWCNWGKHDQCTFEHPENVKVTCDCRCHLKVS